MHFVIALPILDLPFPLPGSYNSVLEGIGMKEQLPKHMPSVRHASVENWRCGEPGRKELLVWDSGVLGHQLEVLPVSMSSNTSLWVSREVNITTGTGDPVQNYADCSQWSFFQASAKASPIGTVKQECKAWCFWSFWDAGIAQCGRHRLFQHLLQAHRSSERHFVTKSWRVAPAGLRRQEMSEQFTAQQEPVLREAAPFPHLYP